MMTVNTPLAKPNIILICPAMNEAKGIGLFLRQLDEVLAPLAGRFHFRVVVVDDGSTDDTASQVCCYCAESFQLTLCQLSRNFGKESAIQAGLERYAGDAVIVMDTDLQHPPELIPRMLEYWGQGISVVEAVKIHRGGDSSLYRWSCSVFYKAMQVIAGLPLEGHSDFKLLDAGVVESLLKLPERIRFFRGLVSWAGFSRAELPFEVPERQAGATSWGGMRLLRYSIRNLTAFSSAPLYLISFAGALMLVVSAMIGSRTLWLWATGEAVTGFTTVILLLLFIGSLLLISLGVIGLYIARIYEEVKQRPLYLVCYEADVGEYPKRRVDSVP